MKLIMFLSHAPARFIRKRHHALFGGSLISSGARASRATNASMVARAAPAGTIVKHGPGHVEVVLVLPRSRDAMPVFTWQQHLEH